jgi:3-phenylpropionate/cinnamic acid dioxygenase small subunit
MSADLFAAYDLLAQYGFLVDSGKYEEWLDLFSPRCSYYVKPRENHELGLAAALIYCDSRTMLAGWHIHRGAVRRVPDRAGR